MRANCYNKIMQAIIFDFFGVISIHATRLFFETHIPHYADRQAEFKELTQTHNLGLISSDEYIQRISEETKLSPTACLTRMQEERKVNVPLLEYIKQDLKPYFKVGLLSNAGPELVQYVDPKLLQRLFDEIVISAEVGLIKPDPRIFTLTCERLGVPTTTAVMVDDLEENCVGARLAGLRAVRYTSLEQVKHDIAAL
jgi:putative hydrolase of the HAD superfamily